MLPPAALIDSGVQYRAVVANSLGSLTSSPAILSVRPNLRLLAGALGGPGYSDGAGAAARFDFTRGSAVDANGNVYVTDSENQVIRRITASGEVTTVAGTPGVRGRVDGTVGSAKMAFPRSAALDATGSLWFIDQGTCYLRKLAGGAVTSVASLPLGGGRCWYGSSDPAAYDPAEIAISPAGEIYVSDRQRGVILRVDAAGTVSLFAGSLTQAGHADGPRLGALFRSPRGLAFDAAGNLYVAESTNATIRRIDAAGTVTTIAGAPQQHMHLDGVGTAARLTSPIGLTLAGSQLLAVTDVASHTVRLLDLTTLALTTIAGNPGISGVADGTGLAAQFNSPYGISSYGGVLYVSDSINSTVRKVTLVGAVSTLAGQPLPSGTADGTGGAARFAGNHPIAADAGGNIYVADGTNHTIRKVTPAGQVTTIAGAPGQLGLVDGSGSAARFSRPTGLAVDSAGNIIVADNGNHAVRKITPTGVVTTLAGGLAGRGYVNGPALTAQFDSPLAVTLDVAGNVYVADELNCVIRKISTAGMVGTLAGAGPTDCTTLDGPAGTASMLWPQLLIATGVDDVIFSELPATRLRRARGDGSLLAVVGSGEGAADGQGTAASFSSIAAIARDVSGNLYVSDAGNHAVRLVRPNFAVSTLLRNPPANTVLGEPPSIRYPTGITVLPGNAIAISTEAAIVVD